jgi:hypothetical protein
MTWWNNSPGELYIYRFHVDWATPGNSTFTGPTSIPIADWTFPCGFAPCVPQLDSPELLDTLADRLMNRLAYRNFGTHESLVTNYTVGTAGGETAVRWFELRNPAGTAAPVGNGGGSPPFIHQQGTYAPDANFRWMASIAQDRQGNMALGYSISSDSMHPSIAITGRLESDPLGQMGAEDIFLNGTGSQVSSFSRWGDYSSMAVDPVDDCTFWYTQEYYQVTGAFDFNTRVGSFKFPSCTDDPTGTVEGTVTDGSNPISGATVTADGSNTTTDAAGHYTLPLLVGTYDMTATKFGFFPDSASGVAVTDGGTTTQDFTLVAAPSMLVNGTVRDAAGGWPLYARIEVSAPGYSGATLWTDPVTGYYGITLVEGVTYTFAINAVSPGYLPGGGPVPLGVPLANAPFVVQNWTLTADVGTCNAPGYTQDVHGLFEDFSGGVIPPGWTVQNNSTDGGPPWIAFEGPDPCGLFGGNQTGGSGPYAIVNSNCDGVLATAMTNLITPSVDLSSFGSPVIRFNSDFTVVDSDYPQLGEVDYSIDGGANWTNVLVLDGDDPGPTLKNIPIPGAANKANVSVRFHYEAFWAWWWQVDNVVVGDTPGCVVGTGGLVVGNVTDASNGNGLNGATVENIGGGSTTTFATPDPNQGDGFYILYSEAGPNDYEASLNLYQPDQGSALVVPGSTQRLDFSLASGLLTASPSPLSARGAPGGFSDMTLNLTNTGTAPASFAIRELNVPATSLPVHHGPFADPDKVAAALARIPEGFQRQVVQDGKFSVATLPPPPDAPQNVAPLVAGDVITTYPASFASPQGLPYGMMFNQAANDFWVSNLDSGFPGDNKDHRFLGNGTQTGETIDMSSLGYLPVDGAYNGRTGMLWQATNDFFGFTNTCVYELNPTTMAMTGSTICPAFPTPQTGLAYDTLTDTYYSGSFFDLVINHFDSNGTILDSAYVGLNISGLAFNQSTGHLFVFQQDVGSGPTDDVYVLDVNNNYAVLGSFVVGPPGINPAAAGGAEMDCDGHLLLVDQLGSNPILVVDSGEGTDCPFVNTIPWVSEDPTEGTVPGVAGARPAGAGNVFPVAVTFDSTGLLPGLRQAQLTVKTDTPAPVAPIPLDFTVRFLDVPDANQFQAYIYGAAGAGIMMGGPPNCPAGVLYFCPDGVVTRADMAGYIWRAVMGANTPPPVYQNIFTDVTFNQYNSFYIQGIFDLGITAGCNVNPPLYCPNSAITRAQTAVFVWKGEHGETPPPACTGVFADVPCPGGFAVDYIEGIYNEGVTAGCGGGNFCPNANTNNGQMAVFLVKGFNIPYLP